MFYNAMVCIKVLWETIVRGKQNIYVTFNLTRIRSVGGITVYIVQPSVRKEKMLYILFPCFIKTIPNIKLKATVENIQSSFNISACHDRDKKHDMFEVHVSSIFIWRLEHTET